MENLVIIETENTPGVNFNAETGIMVIEGESFPNLAMRFYQPLMDWVQLFLAQTRGPAVINFKYTYFNTSSSKCIINLLMLMEGAHAAGKSVEVNWHYRNGDANMEESGRELAEGLTLPFVLVQS
jgi:hypothetical protein